MADLSTCYLGLKLKNPLIVASSGLTSTVEGVRKAAAAGAGAVVLKSLFEEQLDAELAGAEAALTESAHPEAWDFLRGAGGDEGAREYLRLVTEAKEAGIPVIASLNCRGAGRWADFAGRIEAAGADALELNMGFMPASTEELGEAVEERLLGAFREARAATKLPLAVKLGPYFSSLPAMAAELSRLGANGLVFFNRFYRLDVDLGNLAIKPGPARSTGVEYHESLRWIALLADRVSCDLAASTGVHDAEAALKLVAAGASAVQLCSALYKRGFGVIGEINRAMDDWLGSKHIESITSLKGRLAQWKSRDPSAYLRLQYIQALTGLS